jgi:hypothetical protein
MIADILPALLGFIGGLIAVLAVLAKTRAETAKIRVDIQAELQEQIDELRATNTGLYDVQTKRRDELDRIHGEMANMQNLLSSEIARNVALADEVRSLRLTLAEKDEAIHSLGLKIEAYKVGIKDEVKKQTGSLANKLS